MATLLYKLGLFSARNAWKVIVAWIVLLVITASLALTLGGKLTTSMSISGVPSQIVVDKLQTTFPDASRGSGQVVFFKESGSFTDADRAAITTALEEVETLPEVSEAVNPFTVKFDNIVVLPFNILLLFIDNLELILQLYIVVFPDI